MKQINILSIAAGMFFLLLAVNVCFATTLHSIGDYVRDTNVDGQSIMDFYDKDTGFVFSTGIEIYGHDNFTDFVTTNTNQTRSEADLLATPGNYPNLVTNLAGRNYSFSDFNHNVSEEIIIDNAGLTYYEEGLSSDNSEGFKMAIAKDAVSYKVETGFIPISQFNRSDCSSGDCVLDYEYRGKIIFFGEEYYVKDIDGDQNITLDNGQLNENLTNTTFGGNYNGYTFKVVNLTDSLILLSVKKPNNVTVNVSINSTTNGVVDDIELFGYYVNTTAQSASIIVYDTTTEAILKDGEDLVMGGETYENWEVGLDTLEACSSNPVCNEGIIEYENMTTLPDTPQLLTDITITYNHALDDDEALEVGEALGFPNDFFLRFKGYTDTDFRNASYSGEDDGNITLAAGDEPYQMVMNFTGNNSIGYTNVRLDNGPFSRFDTFIISGDLYEFTSYHKDEGATNALDTMTINLSAVMHDAEYTLAGITKYCSDSAMDPNIDETLTGAVCSDDDIKFRELALINALNSTGVDQDANYSIDPSKLWVDEVLFDGGVQVDMLFADDKLIFLPTGFVDRQDSTPDVDTLAVKSSIVGNFSDFDVGSYNLSINVSTYPNTSANYLGYRSVVNFFVEDGMVSVNLYDRNHTSIDSRDYYNNMTFYNSTTNLAAGNEIEVLNSDTDTTLIVPEGGDVFIADYDADNRILSVELQHPMNEVDSTYFIGTLEEEIFGDADGDGNVAYSDLLILARSYGQNSTELLYNSTADFNGDNKVDYADLLLLASEYGFGAG